MSDWETVPLGEIATVRAGNPAPQGKEAFAGGGLPFIRTSDVGAIHVGEIRATRDQVNATAGKKLKLFPAGTVLFPKSGASTFTNHRVLMRCDAYVASHLAAIKAIPTNALDEYLFYYLQTVDARDLVQDQSYPSLNLKAIAAIPTPLPPLDEQRRIVATLDEALGEIDELKRNRQAKIEAFDSVKTSMLTELLQPNPEAATSGGTAFRSFGGVVNFTRRPRGLKIPEVVSHLPMEMISEDGSDILAYKERPRGKAKSGTYFETGDLLLSRIHPCFENGKHGIALDVPGGWGIATTEVYALRSQELDARYLAYFFRSPAVRNKLIPQMEGATGRQRVTKASLAALRVPVPPLDEQRRIVTTLEEATLAVDVGRSAAAEELELADAIASSLITELLTAAR